ncbi:hypothetical protein RhiirC2_798099 [Rhizophagus irregularis]|uniref:Uncharacterized protein n=1 Tax=Rhizophagus irregularis TaxID=588596 RepID=A0A2N1M710_9GLOM|nr:hypothetical protein RhiirC2_798099 [Rhizophagus irregularis]
MSLGKMYHLLLYLEWDISLIHGDLGIVSYTNPKISELIKMQENIFKCLDGPLRDVPSVEAQQKNLLS